MINNNNDLTEENSLFLSSPASKITEDDIIRWNNKSDFNDSASLSIVAKTGSYNDLKDKFSSINFNTFIFKKENNNSDFMSISNDETQILKKILLENCYYENISSLYSSPDDKNSLISQLTKVLFDYKNGRICYIQDGYNFYHLITNIIPTYNNNNKLKNIFIACAPQVFNNFNSLTVYGQETINNLEYYLTIPSIIVDLSQNILYSILKRIYPPQVESYGLGVNYTNGAITLMISNKDNNKLSIIENEEEQGLYCK